MRVTPARPVRDEIVAGMHRVRVYRPSGGALVVVAEPRAENRSVAASAREVWARHWRDGMSNVLWFEVLDARRVGDRRAPLVVCIDLAIDAAGVPHLARWTQTSWAAVEAAVGGRVALAHAGGRLPTIERTGDAPTRSRPAAPESATRAAPGAFGTADRHGGDTMAQLRRRMSALHTLWPRGPKEMAGT